MIKQINACGVGIAADLSPEELGDGVWSSASNMRFSLGYAQRFKGTAQAFAAPSVTPYYIAPYSTSTARYWVHAGLNAVYVDDGTTRTDITGAAPTGAIDDRWTGGSINGVLILNNGKDVPMYWGGDVVNNLATIPGWDASWRADSLRPFKNFIVAMGITKGAVKYPHMVKWCTELEPGAISTAGDWDENDPLLDAGEVDLAETGDLIVDALPLGDVLIVYKERSMYAATYSQGSPYILNFRRLPGESGMLARGCAVNTPLGHVVLTAGDVVLNTGQGVTSISNGLVRDLIFKNIDAATYKRSFVTCNPQRNEVWICIPSGTSTTCNKALIWNWIDKTWAVRELTNVTYGAFGQVNYTAGLTTWSDPGTWEMDATSWNENEYSPAEARLLMCHSTPYISFVDTGTSDFGALISASLERTGITLGDAYSIKTIRSIRPKIDGNTGAVVNIQVGASMYPDSSPTWQTAQPFTIGQSIKVDSFATGRYLAIRFTNTDYGPWRMKSFDIDYVTSGAY